MASHSRKRQPRPADIQQADAELQATQVTRVQTTTRIGPLPPPDELREYEVILPGMANRLLVMVEKEQKIQRSRVRGAILVALALVAVAALAVWQGAPYAAIPLGFVGIVAGVGQVAVDRLLNGRPKAAPD